MYQLINILSYTPPVILMIGIIMGVYLYVQSKIKSSYKVLVLFLIACFIIDLLSRYFSIKYGNNLVFINLSATVELMMIYYFLNQLNTSFQKVKFLGFVLLLVFNIYEYITIDFSNFQLYQSYTKSINSIFLLTISVAEIVRELMQGKTRLKNSILSIFVFYFAINAVLSLPLNLLINYDDEIVFYVWLFNILNISIFYLFLIIYLWKSGRILKR